MICTNQIDRFWNEYYRKISEGKDVTWFQWGELLYIADKNFVERLKNKGK